MNENDIELEDRSGHEKVGARSSHDDPSNKIWAVYMSEAWLHDKGLVESWKSDMDGMLIFAGLFSASVTAFIVESYQNLKQSPVEAQLAVISQQLFEMSNSLPVTNTSSTNARGTNASPRAVRVNYFWFLSLCLGLICALTATLVQQWSRSYLQAIERHASPNQKARVRTYLYYGVEVFKMKSMVEFIPTLLHIAVFLFFAGLVDFLLDLGQTPMAYTILATISIFGALYLVITLLPIIYRHCPYRTPLTHVCWRFFQLIHLLRYKNSEGRSVLIKGGFTVGRQTLATEDLPGRNQRDADALCWTLESLTEDTEIEKILDGIPFFLSTFSLDPSTKMTALSSILMRYSTSLLKTCKEPSPLGDYVRLKRVTTCSNAFLSAIKHVDMQQWTEDWMISIQTVTRALAVLKADQMQAVARKARGTIELTTAILLDHVVAWTKRPELIQSWAHQQRTTGQVKTALQCFDILNSKDAIIAKIPLLVESRRKLTALDADGYRLGELFRLGEILFQLQKCIPEELDRLVNLYPAPITQPLSRQTRAESCMNALRIFASDLHFNIDSARSLARLKNDQWPKIAHYAKCTAARLACQAQLGIVHSIRISPDKKVFVDSYMTLDALDLLESLDVSGLRRQLKLGLDLGLTREAVVETLWEQRMMVDIQTANSDIPLRPEDLKLLDELQLRIAEGKVDTECPLYSKYVLTRGRTAILIGFLNSISGTPVPDQELLETLSHITKSTLARFTSQQAQTLLVKLSRGLISSLLVHLHEQPILVRQIIAVLFDVLQTVGSAECIEETKVIMREYLNVQPDSQWTKVALRTLERTVPLIPLPD